MPVWIEWNLIQCLVDIGSWMNIHLTFGWPQVGMDYLSLSLFPLTSGYLLIPTTFTAFGTRWWDPPWGRNASGIVSFHSTPVQFYTKAGSARARGRWDWHFSHWILSWIQCSSPLCLISLSHGIESVVITVYNVWHWSITRLIGVWSKEFWKRQTTIWAYIHVSNMTTWQWCMMNGDVLFHLYLKLIPQWLENWVWNYEKG